MTSPRTHRMRRAPRSHGSRAICLLAAGALVLAACGSDDDSAEVDVPDEGTGNPYTQAIIEADSHDEVLLSDSSDMVVAVQCIEGATAIVTTVGSELPAGTYTGSFEPSTGVDLNVQSGGAGYASGASQMSLDADEYTVTFADIDGGVTFTVAGCPAAG